MVGRAPDADIAVAHASVSRYHVVLQFGRVRKDGREVAFYVFDLDSTHGTFVNGKKVMGRTFVPLFDGDFLKLGESTRRYVVSSEVRGDHVEEKERGEDVVVDRRARDDGSWKEKGGERREEEEEEEVLWGLDDHVDEGEQDVNIGVEVAPLDLGALMPSQRIQWEKLEKRREKLANMISERESIRGKEIDGLTDGQRHRLELLEEKIGILSGQIEDAEMQLKTEQAMASANHGRENRNARRKDENGDVEEEDTGLFGSFDDLEHESTIKSVETRTTLESKLKDFRNLLREAKYFRANVENSYEGKNVKAQEDSLDAFMNDNEKALKQEAMRKAQGRVDKLELAVSHVKALLKKVTGTESAIEPSEPMQRTTEQRSVKDNTASFPGKRMVNEMPQSVLSPLGELHAPGKDRSRGREKKQDELDSLVPRKRQVSESVQTNEEHLQAVRTTRTSARDDKVERGVESLWEPPKDQTGDGYTVLNEKYGY